MLNWLLELIGEKRITKWLMNRCQFPELGSQDNKVLQEVFFRVPEIKTWLKQMQVRLLRNTLVDKKQAEQREGQILFIELLLANDIPSGNFQPKKSEQQPEELKITKDEFLNAMNKETQK